MAKEKGQTDKRCSTKTLHKKLKIEQHEHHFKPGLNSDAPEEHAMNKLTNNTMSTSG